MKIAVENCETNREPQPTVPTSGRFKVTSFLVLTVNLELNSVPKEETFPFPIPLKYIDVAMSTHTDLDVLQEKRILMTTGMSIRKEVCQILGKDSQNSLF